MFTATSGCDGSPDNNISPLFSGIHIGDPSAGIYSSFPNYRHLSDNKSYAGDNNGCSSSPSMEISMTNGNHGYVHIKMDLDAIGDEYTSSSSPGSSSIMSPSGDRCSSPAAVAIGYANQLARKQKDDKICGVCGDKALGYNFDAISCESCKAFFRRNAPKGLEYFKCPYNEQCKMDISNRRFCKRCRLKRCFDIGMKKEYILSDDEKARKRKKIEENRQLRQHEQIEGLQVVISDVAVLPAVCQPPLTSISCPLSPVDAELIEELVRAYDLSLTVSIEKILPRDSASTLTDLANIAELSVRRVIDMAKKISTFRELPQPDQIALLKGGSIELLIIRAVLTFDKDKNHFLDPTDQEDTAAMNVSQFQRAEDGTGLFDENMKFVRSLAIDLKADRVTLILLLVIALFSPDRPSLVDRERIAQQQERYSLLLQRYLESRFSTDMAHVMYPKLLMKLTDIRDLSEKHSHVLLKVNADGIQPLMQEVLDLRR